MNTTLRTTAALLGLSLASVAVATDDPGKDFSIQLFLNACVTSYAHASAVAAQSKEMGLAETTGDVAASYLGGRPGRVWYGENDSGAFAVSLLSNGLCTVFAHKGNGERIRAGLESWLPPTESAITVARDNIQSPPGLTSTAYTLRGGKVREQWVLTVALAPESPMRASMSYEAQ
jgi:hypothetical protein